MTKAQPGGLYALTDRERSACGDDKGLMIRGELRRTCRIGHDLQLGCVAIKIFKSIGIVELAAPQQGTVCSGETGFDTHGIPVIDDAGELVSGNGNSLLAGQQKMPGSVQAGRNPTHAILTGNQHGLPSFVPGPVLRTDIVSRCQAKCLPAPEDGVIAGKTAKASL
ncbi:MAG: hypothetical protein PVI28_16825 [Gammaproteobacteria bacterium]